MTKTPLFEDRNKIIEIRRKIEKLEEEEKRVLDELQENCRHTVILETPLIKGNLGALSPIRICVFCGLEEEGWNYNKLKAEPLKIINNRDEFFTFRKLLKLNFAAVPVALINEDENKEK